MERVLTVSQAARELGRSADWLRESEKRGKLPKARRDSTNRWRVYTEEDIKRLRELIVPSTESQESA